MKYYNELVQNDIQAYYDSWIDYKPKNRLESLWTLYKTIVEKIRINNLHSVKTKQCGGHCLQVK